MRDTRSCLASVRTVHCVASGGLVLSVVSRIFFSNSAVSVRRGRLRVGFAVSACTPPAPNLARAAITVGRDRPSCLGDRVIRHAFLGQQNHPAFLGHSLWRGSGADQRFQLHFSGVINGKSGGGGKHDPIESWPGHIVNSYVGRDTRKIAASLVAFAKALIQLIL